MQILNFVVELLILCVNVRDNPHIFVAEQPPFLKLVPLIATSCDYFPIFLSLFLPFVLKAIQRSKHLHFHEEISHEIVDDFGTLNDRSRGHSIDFLSARKFDKPENSLVCTRTHFDAARSCRAASRAHRTIVSRFSSSDRGAKSSIGTCSND